MDDNKKIINALNDIAVSIEEIAKHSREKNNKPEGKIFQNSDFAKPFESIKDGIKNIKKDTEKILKNQESLKHISKDKKSTLFEKIGQNTKKIKDGASTVVLIAAGILAIGIAFKLIGQVDFASVIALSISLPLIAIAFEKISTLKGLKASEMKNLFFVIVTMAASLTAASWIMSLIHPISITQGLTAIFISGIFYLASTNLWKLRASTIGITNKDMINMGKVLLGLTSVIVASSWIMKLIAPISISQGLTAILISGIFYATTLNIEKLRLATLMVSNKDMENMGKVLIGITATIVASSWLMKLILPISLTQGLTAILISGLFYLTTLNIEKLRLATLMVSNKDMENMGKVLLGITATIVASSWIMKLISPISFGQALTAILISGIFYLTTLNIEKLRLATLFIKEKDMENMGKVLLGITATIVASSWLMQLITPISLSQGLTAIALSLVLSIAGLTIGLAAFALSKIGLSTIIEGGLAIVAIATTIMVSSWILGKGNYDKYPNLDWAEGTGLSLLAFGLSALAFGILIETGVGAAALIAGVAAIGMSAVIMTSSWILSKGNYNKYPNLDWAKGTGLSLLAFGLSVVALGAIAITGIGIGALILGGIAVVGLAKIITISADILGKGNYGNYPTLEWSKGVGESLSAFGSILSNMGLKGIILNVIGDVLGEGPENIAFKMLNTDTILSMGKFTNYPSLDWSEGVAKALSAFGSFAGNMGLGGIALNKIGDWFGTGPEDIAKQIIKVNDILNTGKFSNNIPSGYMQSMSDNIKAYVDLIGYLQEKNIGPLSFISTISASHGLSKIADGYDKLSKSVSSLSNSLNTLDIEKLNSLKSLTGSIILMSLMDSDQFNKMMDALESKGGIFVKLMEQINETAEQKQKSLGTLNTIKSTSGKTGATTDDVYGALVSIDGKMGKLVSNTNTFVSFIDELRSNNNSIKQKNHF